MYPSVLTTFSYPNATDKLNAPSHSSIEGAQSSAIGQLETVIGVEGATSVVGTLQYLIKSSDSDGGGHVQTAVLGGTGQTTFTKGDVFVATSASVISKLAITATDGFALVSDSSVAAGIKWGVPNNEPTVRVYSSVSTWVKPSTLAYAIVEVQGGGGVGANGASGGTGKGGGGGAYAKKIVLAADLPTVASIFIAAGLRSHFGSVLVADAGLTGPGGSVVAGDLNINGGNGGDGDAGTQRYPSGQGGEAFLGTAGKGVNSGAGKAGTNGGGGSGGQNTAIGGGSVAGIIVITEY